MRKIDYRQIPVELFPTYRKKESAGGVVFRGGDVMWRRFRWNRLQCPNKAKPIFILSDYKPGAGGDEGREVSQKSFAPRFQFPAVLIKRHFHNPNPRPMEIPTTSQQKIEKLETEKRQIEERIRRLRHEAKTSERKRLTRAKIILGVGGHFKMHHLWSLQSAPLWTG